MSKGVKMTLLYISRLFILLFSVCALNSFFHQNTSAAEVLKPAIPGNELGVPASEMTNITPNYSNEPTILPTTPLFAAEDINNRKTLRTNIDIVNLYKQMNDKSERASSESSDGKLLISDNKVVKFSPSINGQIIDPVASAINASYNRLPVIYSVRPKIALADTNSLGINELVARGISDFKGSSKNRRTNIKVATEKMRGTLVAPGANFSFNDNLGDVTAKDGFVPEIVIKKDGLKPELGGGVCQVSSTVFRAAMASGMPIIERKNHSFPVNHYTPTGSDATVYTGVVDFKFTNDTPGYIMIWPYFPEEDTLIFDIYGTNDERIVKIKDPVKYGFQSNGIFKTKWERTVQRPGMDTRTDSLVSTYLPASWFKKEEKFVIAQPISDNNNPPQAAVSPAPTALPTPNTIPPPPVPPLSN